MRALAAIRHVIIGHASEITTLKIYAHVMRQKRDDATDRIAVLAGLAPSANNRETIDDLEREECDVSDGIDSGPCRTRTYNQRIKRGRLGSRVVAGPGAA